MHAELLAALGRPAADVDAAHCRSYLSAALAADGRDGGGGVSAAAARRARAYSEHLVAASEAARWRGDQGAAASLASVARCVDERAAPAEPARCAAET